MLLTGDGGTKNDQNIGLPQIVVLPGLHGNDNDNDNDDTIAILLGELLQTRQPTNPTKATAAALKISEKEMRHFLLMCDHAPMADLRLLPKWMHECAAKHMTDAFHKQIKYHY